MPDREQAEADLLVTSQAVFGQVRQFNQTALATLARRALAEVMPLLGAAHDFLEDAYARAGKPEGDSEEGLARWLSKQGRATSDEGAICPYCQAVDRDAWEYFVGTGDRARPVYAFCGSCKRIYLCDAEVEEGYDPHNNEGDRYVWHYQTWPMPAVASSLYEDRELLPFEPGE